ncbi:hypothetical protein [Vibrio comitans]|uniref:Fimbrial protein n=1 Tax=Vibrio comitans NBRC 102076 TaxID=1219078 RepID=A0A4Y3IJT4_9VIBR|nr:hypothetical protein [Vibrio comitans]GEA59272.1 hypothetical protein VCO01S_04650 [Vibrio comitans NBRC 102076]
MKKQLLAIATTAALTPAFASATNNNGEVIWNGDVDPACGWDVADHQPGKLGFVDFNEQQPAKATLVNNKNGNDQADLAMSTTTSVAGGNGAIAIPTTDIMIKLVDGENETYPEQESNTVFNNVPAGDLKFYARAVDPATSYSAGTHTVTTTFTVTCN